MLEALYQYKWFYGYVTRKFVGQYLKNVGDWCVRAEMKKGKTDIIVCVVAGTGPFKEYSLVHDRKKGWYFLGMPNESHPTPKDLLFSSSKTLKRLQLTTAIERPPIFIPPGSIEWEDCSATPLGKGAYGTVVQAVANINQEKYAVAVKVPRTIGQSFTAAMRSAVMMEMDQMVHEAVVMQQLKHENVVKCFGLDSSETQFKLVLDLCPGGSLLSHLRHCGHDIKMNERVIFGLEAARGLKYLHKVKCLHRDIAARNCLLGKDGLVKLSDFGISIMEGCTTPNEDKIKIPIPWLAPECLAVRPRYSTKSDVFSFAILMYEIVTDGKEPWPEYRSTEEIAVVVRCGMRMSLPLGIPGDLHRIITSCWSQIPFGRPEFFTVVHWLRTLLDDVGIPSFSERSISKFCKHNVQFTDDGSDYELDECSPPPTSEEKEKREKADKFRMDRMKKGGAPQDFNNTSDDVNEPHNKTKKGLLSKRRTTFSQSITRLSEAPQSESKSASPRKSAIIHHNRRRRSGQGSLSMAQPPINARRPSVALGRRASSPTATGRVTGRRNSQERNDN
ncbi:unnamed protein product [Bursaphelenchus okinawaensis]|uniref:Protein kinase domain-containing protein n=1 Tax=Bursaphelenchus okinawaensis TaxID=465554 RepID=A0A811LAM7_9BILA|nr:unnamed protein product [Bursaphelenchus okinawaensis]CAG9119718.1 unnamed protein product [Bursaphelenchus okinawaensis]